MGHEAFHVRDISVIVSALARVHCTDAATVGRFASCAVATLPEATPLELSRLMHACMSVSCADEAFFSACVLHSREQTACMDPGGLSGAAFAFGQCFEAAQVQHLPYLRQIFRHIRLASVASLPLFLPREVVSLLRTYARWQITFECVHLRKVADRMLATRTQFDLENSVAALYSLAQLMQRNTARSAPNHVTAASWEAAGHAARQLLAPVWNASASGRLDIATVVRAVEASAVLCPDDASLRHAISTCVVRRRADLDGPSCAVLYEHFTQLGCSPEEDLMLVLAQGLSSPPVS